MIHQQQHININQSNTNKIVRQANFSIWFTHVRHNFINKFIKCFRGIMCRWHKYIKVVSDSIGYLNCLNIKNIIIALLLFQSCMVNQTLSSKHVDRHRHSTLDTNVVGCRTPIFNLRHQCFKIMISLVKVLDQWVTFPHGYWSNI